MCVHVKIVRERERENVQIYGWACVSVPCVYVGVYICRCVCVLCTSVCVCEDSARLVGITTVVWLLAKPRGQVCQHVPLDKSIS